MIDSWKFNDSLLPLAKLINLITLDLGYKFNQSIEPLKYLTTLKRLTISTVFNHLLEPLVELNIDIIILPSYNTT